MTAAESPAAKPTYHGPAALVAVPGADATGAVPGVQPAAQSPDRGGLV